MGDLDTREWLLTNGLGSFASGTISDARTRTYHGWLIAALDPPSKRTLLLSHLEASLEVGDSVVALGTNFWGSGTVEPSGYKLLQRFEISPVPTWIWGQDNWQLSRRIVMPNQRQEARGVSEAVASLCSSTMLRKRASRQEAKGERQEKVKSTSQQRQSPQRGEPPHSTGSPIPNPRYPFPQHPTPNTQHPFCHRILIQYRYEGSEGAKLMLRLMIGDRDFHHQQQDHPMLQFSQIIGKHQVCLQAVQSGQVGTAWQLRWTQGEYQPDPVWYWDYWLPEETKRGLGDREDLYSPGYLTVILQPGTTVTIEATTQLDLQHCLNSEEFEQAVQAEQKRLADQFAHLDDPKLPQTSGSFSPCPLPWQQLLQAGDQFIVYRASIAGPTAIAGYHWFNDWGRDTLIALPGLALTTQRFDLAKGLLQTFGRYCQYGLIPN